MSNFADIRLSIVCLFLCLPISLSVPLSVCLFLCLSHCLSASFSVCLINYLCLMQWSYPPSCTFIVSVCLSESLPVYAYSLVYKHRPMNAWGPGHFPLCTLSPHPSTPLAPPPSPPPPPPPPPTPPPTP